MLGIIGGSGFYFLKKNKGKPRNVKTPYGDVEVQIVNIGKKEIVFIPRHGKGHDLPPHKVNYRANIYALKELGVTAVLGTYAAGLISRAYRPGDLILIEDFIGLFTPITFYDDFSEGMRHIDFTYPYNKELQMVIEARAKANKIRLKRRGIIATTHGPRYETKAEIKALKKAGANLVSMTHAYEATLIGELEIPFVAVAIGTNYACGVSRDRLDQEDVLEVFEKSKGQVVTLIDELIKTVE